MQAVMLCTLEATPVAFTRTYAAGLVTVVATALIMDRYSTSISAMADGKQAWRSAIMAGEHVMPRATTTVTIAPPLPARCECELPGGMSESHTVWINKTLAGLHEPRAPFWPEAGRYLGRAVDLTRLGHALH